MMKIMRRIFILIMVPAIILAPTFILCMLLLATENSYASENNEDEPFMPDSHYCDFYSQVSGAAINKMITGASMELTTNNILDELEILEYDMNKDFKEMVMTTVEEVYGQSEENFEQITNKLKIEMITKIYQYGIYSECAKGVLIGELP